MNSVEHQRTDEMASDMRIAAIFDTSFGLGTPQLELLVASLTECFPHSSALLFELDIKGKPKLRNIPGLEIRRIATRLPPHFDAAYVDYNNQVSRQLAAFAPDIVLVTSAAVFPALLRLRQKPRLVIYYMLESLQYQSTVFGDGLIDLVQMARPWIDLVCVPEIDRAHFDLKWLQWDDVPIVELLNVSSSRYFETPKDPTPRVILAGSISEDTLCHYFEDDTIRKYPVDVCGILATDRMRSIFRNAGSGGGATKYLGVLDSDELNRIYGRYAYSVCMWRPDNINQIHASPNKLFQSIAHGVPPIAAPHPQCVRIIRDYGCGILLKDWSRQAFTAGLDEALDVFNSPRYGQMVENCRIAVEDGLNWPSQFDKLRPWLRELTS